MTMGAVTSIPYVHHTFSPWWGCAGGCSYCYAARVGHRFGIEFGRDYRFFGLQTWQEPERWNRSAARAGERRRVLCGSMCDVWEQRDELAPHRVRLCRLIEATPQLDWLLLTKQPQNILELAPALWRDRFPGNAWVGTTAEDQPRAFERTRHLLQVNAAVRFLSLEPMLEDIELEPTGALGCDCHCEIENLDADGCTGRCQFYRYAVDKSRRIDWVIVGGESGPKARPFNLSHARNIVHDCEAAGVACFVKQMGANPVDSREVDDDEDPLPVKFEARSGEDPSEWEPYLQVRQFPEVRP